MITVEEALERIEARVRPLPAQLLPADGCLHRVLAEPIESDVDAPPHDACLVDGYALRAADVSQAGIMLRVLEEVVAGSVPTMPVQSGTATRVMTGAPLPQGADAVVMHEQTRLDGARVQINITCRAGQNVLACGASIRRGEIVLEPGTVLRAAELGLLATLGRTDARVIPAPTVAVLATGNELVPTSARPGPGQLRNSNGPMLLAAARSAGAHVVDLGVGRDELQPLNACIRAGLAFDVLLISGGVSEGVLDLVPQVLEQQGVERVFHKVRLKPGKPVWFGVKAVVPRTTLVFALPGNPVSALVCFELLVLPALHRLAGKPFQGLEHIVLPLAEAFTHRGERPTYQPARVEAGKVHPLAWRGSADLRRAAQATHWAIFPAGDRQHSAGEQVEALVRHS